MPPESRPPAESPLERLRRWGVRPRKGLGQLTTYLLERAPAT